MSSLAYTCAVEFNTKDKSHLDVCVRFSCSICVVSSKKEQLYYSPLSLLRLAGPRIGCLPGRADTVSPCLTSPSRLLLIMVGLPSFPFVERPRQVPIDACQGCPGE